MMKTIYNIMVYLLAVCLFSCQQDDMDSLKGMGYLRLDVSESQEVNTRAAYNPEQLHVEVLDENKKVVEKTDDYTEWKGTVLELPVGKYTIKAYSHAYDGERGFDKAYYYGSQTVTVESGKEVSAKVTCKLANVKVSVCYDEAFLKAFEGREIAVEVGAIDANSSIAPLSFTTTEKRSAYFPETDLYAKISINNPKDPLKPYTLEQKLEGVKVRDHYILNYKLADKGSSDISVTVDPTHNEYNYTFEVNMQESALTADFVPANAWAKFAYLEASNVQSAKGELVPENVTFKYRKKGDVDWNDVITTYQDGKYTATLTPLEGKTEYEYCLADGENMTTVQALTTEEAVMLPNSNFNQWWRIEEKDNSPWYAIASDDATSFDTNKMLFSFWDSGNGGTAPLMRKNPTSPEETELHTPEGKSAKLQSQFVGFLSLGKFAAGNIFTGHFCSANTSTYQAKIYFGQPFTSRPTQLKGWFKYNRGTDVDYPKNGGEYKTLLQQAGGDLCGIYIALVDNEGFDFEGHRYAYEINGDLSGDDPAHFKYKNAIDFSENNKNVIAYGTISEEEAKGTGEWQEFTIDLKYRDITRIPKYIIVVASASKYGDYFTGSTKSVMYIDDFELIYGNEPVLSE